MRALLELKNEEISEEKLITKFEELLSMHTDLLEEAYLFLDVKKVLFFNFRFAITFIDLITLKLQIKK